MGLQLIPIYSRPNLSSRPLGCRSLLILPCMLYADSDVHLCIPWFPLLHSQLHMYIVGGVAVDLRLIGC